MPFKVPMRADPLEDNRRGIPYGGAAVHRRYFADFGRDAPHDGAGRVDADGDHRAAEAQLHAGALLYVPTQGTLSDTVVSRSATTAVQEGRVTHARSTEYA